MHNGVVFLVGVVFFHVGLAREAGRGLGPHADVDVDNLALGSWEFGLVLVDVDPVSVAGEKGLQATGAGVDGRRALGGRDASGTAERRLEQHVSARRGLGRVPAGVGQVGSSLGPLQEDAGVLHVDHDLGALRLTGEAITLEQFPSAALAVQLHAVPAVADNLHLAGLQGVRGGNEAGLDVDAGHEAVGRELVVRRVGRAAHDERLAIFRELDAGHGREGSAFRSGGPRRRAGEDAGAGRRHGRGILEMGASGASVGVLAFDRSRESRRRRERLKGRQQSRSWSFGSGEGLPNCGERGLGRGLLAEAW